MDLFSVPTVTFHVLQVLFVIRHGRREVARCAVTAIPTLTTVPGASPGRPFPSRAARVSAHPPLLARLRAGQHRRTVIWRGTGGVPIPGTRALPGDPGYLLHAARLVIDRPQGGARLVIECPAPPALRRLAR